MSTYTVVVGKSDSTETVTVDQNISVSEVLTMAYPDMNSDAYKIRTNLTVGVVNGDTLIESDFGIITFISIAPPNLKGGLTE